MTKLRVKELLYDKTPWDFSPGSFHEFRTFIDSAVEGCPEYAKDSLWIHLGVDDNCGDPIPELRIGYMRDETDHEERVRVARENADLERQIARARQLLKNHGVSNE